MYVSMYTDIYISVCIYVNVNYLSADALEQRPYF